MRIDLPKSNIQWSLDIGIYDEPRSYLGHDGITLRGAYTTPDGETLGKAVSLRTLHPESGNFAVRKITDEMSRAVGRRMLGLDE